MNKQVELIRGEIERRIKLYEGLSEETVNPNRTDEDRQILSFIDSMSDNTVTSVWHNNSEEPEEDKQILVGINGCYYVQFYYKSEKRFSMLNKPRFYLSEIDEWAYVNDLLKITTNNPLCDDLEDKIQKALNYHASRGDDFESDPQIANSFRYGFESAYQDILNSAVDGVVDKCLLTEKDDVFYYKVHYPSYQNPLKCGDKVKVIILKDD